ncbi:MAG: hypothetical protein HUJ26_10580 [Planctomycetaceae bacterium]|nr:hypothetical protein [Planctomycetaceae bacterium]
MHWFAIFGFITAVIGTAMILWRVPCAGASCELSPILDNVSEVRSDAGHKPPQLVESMRACQTTLEELQQQKQQLDYRLQKLDEMIEASDREIIRFQEQVSLMEQLRSTEITDSEKDMLSWLRAGGYPPEEIARLTARTLEDYDRSA